MKLPRLKLHHGPEWQRERFERWLAEWEIDKDLRAICDDGPSTASDSGPAADLSVSPLSDEPAPQVGQIRLFAPEVYPARNRLLYAALLESAGKNSFLTALFGRFSEPCLPGELLTDRETPCLRVLCLWNATELPVVLLTRSWFVDSISRKELDDALAVLGHVKSGDTLPDLLKKRIGPPQWHPADPRNQYIEEEAGLMSSLLHGSGPIQKTITYPEKDTEWPMAAEPPEPYGEE